MSTPYIAFSILSASITLIAAVIAWRRFAPGSWMLSMLLISMTIWSGSYSARWMDLSLAAKIFWFNIMYLGVLALPTFFLLFVLAFTHHDEWLTRRNLFLLSVQPVVALLLQWTNAYHHLFYSSLQAVQQQGVTTLEVLRGPGYYANVLYSYVILTIGFLLLTRGALRSSPLYANQYRLLLLGSVLPWAGSFYSEFYFDEWRGLDLAPLMFGVTGIIFALAVFRTRFMDLIPVARSYLIENMCDGVLVLDERNRILDMNPAMAALLENDSSAYVGRNASEVFSEWMQDSDFLAGQSETHTELRAGKDPSRYLDLRVTPLYDRDRSLNGRLMVFRDITRLKQVEKTLRYVNDRQQSQLIAIGLLQSKLREQAIRDPLTSLFNRRYLEETLDHELARASREGYSICIAMLDLDHFKKINDTYGHEAGDHVLMAIAATLSDETRRGDFACRYGGEEFVVVMPNIDHRVAYERAEQIRASLNSLYIPYEIYTLTTTISIGIACYPAHGQTREAILRAADKAMYAAKQAGRDHILSYDQVHVPDEALED
jgi:diguanylate cyclase (GGDEF)-like protein/PAS domain S-box-containing protein